MNPSVPYHNDHGLTVEVAIGHRVPLYYGRVSTIKPLGVRRAAMSDREDHVIHQSPARFDENRIRAAAVYCSDGRFGEHFDDFLHNSLKLPRYDRLAAPGGAACLAGRFLAFREEEGLAEQLRFLIRTHRLERVVLIAHENCGFYTERLHVSPQNIETQQREDMQTAIKRIGSFASGLVVESFFARKHPDGTIRFESL